MKALLKEKRRLRKELNARRHGLDLSSPEARRKLLLDTKQTHEIIREVEKRLGACRQELAGLLYLVFREIAVLARRGKTDQIRDLVEVFADVPRGMFSAFGIDPAQLGLKMKTYIQRYGDTTDENPSGHAAIMKVIRHIATESPRQKEAT